MIVSMGPPGNGDEDHRPPHEKRGRPKCPYRWCHRDGFCPEIPKPGPDHILKKSGRRSMIPCQGSLPPLSFQTDCKTDLLEPLPFSNFRNHYLSKYIFHFDKSVTQT